MVILYLPLFVSCGEPIAIPKQNDGILGDDPSVVKRFFPTEAYPKIR